MLWAFIPIATVVTLTPGATTAMVVRSALSGGWRSGARAIAGNEVGVAVWPALRGHASREMAQANQRRDPDRARRARRARTSVGRAAP
jgi:hypothetical protein